MDVPRRCQYSGTLTSTNPMNENAMVASCCATQGSDISVPKLLAWSSQREAVRGSMKRSSKCGRRKVQPGLQASALREPVSGGESAREKNLGASSKHRSLSSQCSYHLSHTECLVTDNREALPTDKAKEYKSSCQFRTNG